jgi:Flp pilus assembly protein TadG
MMARLRHLQANRRSESGATLVEFALVAPVVFLMIFGLIAGCFLAYQNSALHDGASAGARMASIESPLLDPSTGCESGSPHTIATAVAQAAPLLNVNQGLLCANSTDTELTQLQVNGEVNITVVCGGSCTASANNPSTLQVKLTYRTKGLVAPIGLTYSLSATSTDPGPSVVP